MRAEDEHGGYLREYDDDIGGALELVVRDIITAGINRAEAEAMVWSTAEDRLDHESRWGCQLSSDAERPFGVALLRSCRGQSGRAE